MVSNRGGCFHVMNLQRYSATNARERVTKFIRMSRYRAVEGEKQHKRLEARFKHRIIAINRHQRTDDTCTERSTHEKIQSDTRSMSLRPGTGGRREARVGRGIGWSLYSFKWLWGLRIVIARSNSVQVVHLSSHILAKGLPSAWKGNDNPIFLVIVATSRTSSFWRPSGRMVSSLRTPTKSPWPSMPVFRRKWQEARSYPLLTNDRSIIVT